MTEYWIPFAHTPNLGTWSLCQRDPAILAAARSLQQGGIVAFPTETVYGLGALATNPTALRRLFRVKGRPLDNPLILHFANVQRILQVFPKLSRHWARRLWATMPGPITWILAGEIAGVSPLATAHLPTVAVRVPAHPLARLLLQKIPFPVAAPSANRSGYPSPTCAAHVQDDLGESLDGLLVGGSSLWGLESTVIDGSEEPPVLLRQGPYPLAVLRVRLPSLTTVGVDGKRERRSPGTRYRHYAPVTPLWLLQGKRRAIHAWITQQVHSKLLVPERTLLITQSAQSYSGLPLQAILTWPNQAVEMGRVFYATLRQVDTYQAACCLVEDAPNLAAFQAIRDRLHRAATRTIVISEEEVSVN